MNIFFSLQLCIIHFYFIIWKTFVEYCSTVTTWGKDGEPDAFRNMLMRFPTGIVSIVSDSYDVFKAVEQVFGNDLHDDIVQRGTRSPDSRLVIRPDSGDPLAVLLKARLL